MTILVPTETKIREIVEQNFQAGISRVERFPTGLCHYVFDVVTENNLNLVVRIARPENKKLLESSIYWHELLKPKGVPLPELLAADLSAEFPYLILARLPGTDLGRVYGRLSRAEKKKLAVEMVNLQSIARALPPAGCFGYLQSYGHETNCRTWFEVIQKSFNRSRERIKKAGIFQTEIVDRVEEKAQNYRDYFSRIEPECFFDDITTKNVIVDQGRLSGVVDVDWMGFGDDLQTIALTRMSLLADNQNLDYVEFWAAAMNLDAERRKILNFYTAVYCLDFMSEIGHRFNQEVPLEIEDTGRKRYFEVLENLLSVV